MDSEELIEQKTGENEHERRVREMSELLEELRVVLPGVQVLFAFLLVVPFSARFTEVTPLQQGVFLGALMCTTSSAGLLIAPSAHHRLLWRRQAKERRLRLENRLAISGMALLVVAMIGAKFLITDFLFGWIAAIVATAASITPFFLYVWFVVPHRHRPGER